MRTVRSVLFVFVALVALLFAVASALPLAAQGEPPPVEVVTDPPAVEEPDPLAPLLAMAASVFASLELIKNLFLARAAEEGGWKESRVYSLLLWSLASILAFVLLLGAPEGLDVFTLSGFTQPFGDLFGRVVTALAIGAGNGILHALYSYLSTPRMVTTVQRVE